MAQLFASQTTGNGRDNSRKRLLGRNLILAASGLACSFSVSAQVSVTTWHNDIGRTGQNLNETILNLSDVNPTQFGKLFSQPVDGYVYAQPLYLPNVTIGGQSHNVVFVATENDSVYAFDANNNGGSNASPLWFDSMLSPAFGAAAGATTVPSGDVGTDISPQVGITGTPVIDPSTGTLYVVSATLEGSTFVQRLHALDVTSGAEKFGAPIVINASVPGTGNGSVDGTLQFDPEWENQRPGLLLLNGIVYIGYASHGDNGPWHGWILGYNAQTLQQTGAFCTTHNGVGGGMWMGGAGLAAEINDPTGHPYGRMFVATGNGDYTASAPYTANMDFGDSILNLDLTNGVPNIQDEFTPFDQATLDANDSDVASGGVMLVPTQTSGSFPNLLVQTGKSGTQYLLNRDNLGGYNAAGDVVVQNLPDSVGKNGAWSTPAYWNGTVYYWGVSDTLKAFPMVNGQLTGPTAVSSETYGYPGANPSISANGTTQGIIWTIESDLYATQGQAVLQAHSASNPATTLYSSNTNLARDNPGPAVKFAVPTIANGLVYVGAEGQLSVFGLLNGQQVAAAPVVTPASESFNGNTANLTVTMTDATTGAVIYYTTDGTTPTINSPVYTVPISLSESATIQALASAPGYLQSAVTTETYVNTSQVATPVFTPGGGTYTQPVLVTISEATSGATIYYTTDGSTPTTSSSVYTAPLTVGASETLNAIAVLSGFANSQMASANYVLNIGQTGINFTSGFAGTTSTVIENGSTDLDDSRLQLTNGESGEAGSAWFYQQVNIQAFTTEFSFQLSNPVADGMTFAIQSQSLTALGEAGGGLGYQSIPSSIAVKFDLFSNDGEGPDSTGLYLNGASPTLPAIDLSSTGINLHSGDTMDIVLDYNGTLLSMTITDLVTEATYSTSWVVNIPAIVGGNTAWVGFTGGTGGSTASQKILTWTYTVGSKTAPTLPPPTFTPAAGSYSTAQSVAIGDAVAGTSIYYTTDGTTPSPTSNLYTSPIPVAASETLSAIAVETGYTTSAVATAAYSISPALPSPTFSPVAGTYTSAQTVAITGAAGTTVYYTTNGTTPTTSSAVYTGPITVSASESVQAIAVQTGFITSPTASAAYVIAPSGTVYIDIPAGGFSASSFDLNYGASVTGGYLQLTDGGSGENHSAWFAAQVPVTSFITDFYFQQLAANADGMTFTIQGEGPTADGGSGGGLGYQGIPDSVAVKFDLFSNSGEGPDSTGLYTDGASPTLPATDMTSSGVNLHSGDAMWAHIVYDGTNLTLTLTDTVTKAVFTEAFPINIPTTVGGNTAYVGFTGGTGGSTAIQNVLAWDWVSPATQSVATPTFSPIAGSYTSAQSVTIADTNNSATIYYTTNGTTPTTSSPVYSAPITVSSTETLNAIAVASGLANSPVATAAYSIGQTLTTPAFSPIAGNYTSAQSVIITGPAGATIYYTTNGTAPTTSSAVYAGPITVSASETLEAIAVETGYTNSATATAVYTISTTLATPTFSPAAGTYTAAQSVAITGPAGATIYYTTNGTAPTTSSAVYNTPITVSASETLEAIAVETGFTNSAVATGVYTITPKLATPTFSPAAGTYTSAQSVTVTGPAGATLYYTTNGTAPTTSSAVYSTPITVSASGTLEAIAVETGYTNSAAAVAAYTITPMLATPTFSPAGGTYTSAQSVTITGPAGATIYYTTNGTTPTTTSAVYSTPIAVSASETIEAIAVETGFTSSATAAAAYTISTTLATPTFSPVAGTYTSTQSVTITGPAGATIYYTTNGTAPNTTSAVYSGPISVSASETLEAIAVETGYNNSSVAAGTYTISTGSTTYISIPADGFTSSTMALNGGAKVTSGGLLQVTDGGSGEARSGWFNTEVPIGTFVTDFTFQQLSATADGMTFAIQGKGSNAIGGNGGGLGYQYLTPSIAVKFDLFSNSTEGPDSTGVYTDGASPTIPATDMTSSGVNLHSGDVMHAHIVYDGTNLTLTLTDTVTNAVFTQAFPVNIPSTIGGSSAYVGFTGGTGGSTAIQNVLSWSYISPAVPAAAPPTFSPAAGPYAAAQSVSLADATTGSTIYYTTNGTTPTTASPVYSTPIAVSATETLEAIAVATGYTNSTVSTAAYTIGATLPAPVFSVAAGPYAAAQSVSITDSIAGATIYYTTNGNTPTTASAVYTTPINVSATETLQAIAVETGYLNSPAASATYTIGATLPAPTFSVSAGPYTTAQSVAITDATAGTTIYYTTNGNTPTTASAVYSTPVSVSATETLEAIAVETGYLNSPAASAAYTIGATLPAPTFSVTAGPYTTAQSVAITDATTGTTIYYTTNGTTPTTASAVYSTPVNVSATETLEAIAVETGYLNSPAASAAYTIGATLPAPTFSVTAGPYTTAQTVGITDATAGTTLYYTTNGTTPTTASAVYSTPVTVSATETLEAIAVETGYFNSPATSAAYTIGATLPAPTFSVAAGAYTTTQTVGITDTTAGTTIYYTTNGNTPTTASAVYSAPVSVSTSETLEAIAVETGYLNSPATSATYTIGATLPPPTFSPAAGPYAAAQTVAIADAVSGTTIYYTTNGTTPTTGSPVYGGPISVSATETLEAIAVETGYTTSATSSAAYTIGATVPAPSFSLAAGSYTTSQTVTIGDTMAGTTIYYTTNGVTPTTSSAVYGGAITIGTTETLQAIAVATGYINSPVTSAAYTITLPAPTPTFSVAPGSYASAQTVAITDSNASAIIYYTTNGVAPTTASTVYSAPIAVSASETLSAIATATGYSTSAVASAAYTITGLTQAATPAFSVAAGTYNAAQSVSITDSTPGVTIYYTVNGTTPTTKSTVYSTPVSVASSETIEAIAVETGYTTSAVGSATYTLAAATPTINNPTGTYGSPLTVILSSATPTATIYYTTNAKTPTSSSTTYTGAFTISSSETVKAIAIETGFTSSTVATAVYTIQSSVPAPTFSLASGTYLSTQTVSIGDSNTAATIYYTTNGVAPTTSSTVYAGPITISASETLEAIAVATGFVNSNTAVASYTISPASSAYINYPTAGFTSASLALNAGATVTSGGLLQLTDGGQGEDRTAWFATPVPVQSFTTDFNFQQLNASGDGMTFAIQGEGPTAVGGNGGGLGYQYIPTSVAIKFDLFSNSGEGPDSTGIYTNGASPTVPANNLTGTGVNLHSGDIMWAHLVYDGTNLTLTLTDTVNGYSATEVYPINIPATVGGSTAYVGFTGGSGGSSATQNVLSWSYVVP